MKGVLTVLQAVLIFTISAALITITAPWIYDSIQKSRDFSEIQAVESEFKLCDSKLIETARTGTSNKCIFSINRGILNAQKDGLYYKITTKAEVCDKHNWMEIYNHLWRKCDVSDSTRIYQLNWYWPEDVRIQGYNFIGNISRINKEIAPIIFNDTVSFRTLSVVVEFEFVPGQAGRIIEINRIGLTEEKAILSINIR